MSALTPPKALRRPPSPLIQMVAILGILSGLASIISLVVYPHENYWPVFFFLTLGFFALVKIMKILLP